MKGLFNRRMLSFVLALVLILAFTVPVMSQAEEAPPVKNIIFFIGDGMGPNHVALTRYYSLYVLGKELNMTRVMNMGSTAYMTHHSLDYIVTDSASAAAAMATGYKTNNGMISMTPDGIPRITILEKAQRMGKSVGLATTARLTHATPACFASHIESRNMENEIAVQMLESGTDVMFGGGWRHWVPGSVDGSKREDDRDLLAEAEEMGYTVVRDAAGFRAVDVAATDKLLGLFKKSHLSYELDRDPEKEPSLAEITQTTIDILSKNENGFFLMVEGGRIDHAAHENDAASVVWDTIAFDEAIGVALDYAAKDPNTLIIVTADHETGGLTVTKGQPTPEDKLEYMNIEDLRRIGQVNASFADVVSGEVEEAADAAAVEKIVEEYTGIDITAEEAQMIKDAEPLTPVLTNQPSNSIGLAVADELSIYFATGHHNAIPLMLFATGPYSDRFTGFLDNTDVSKIMSEAFQTGY